MTLLVRMLAMRRAKRLLLAGIVCFVIVYAWRASGKRKVVRWRGLAFNQQEMVDADMVICDSNDAKQPRVRDQQKWQDVKGRDTIVFSAYYEKSHFVRIVANSRRDDSRPLLCVMWFETAGSSWAIREGVVTVLAQADEIPFHHERPWTSFYYICPLPLTPDIPYAISLAATSCDTAPGNVLAVLNTPDVWRRTKVMFGLCFPMIMNDFSDIVPLVETLEMHRILGVEKVVVYNVSMGKAAESLIREYQTEGFVDVVQWNIMDKLTTWTHPGTPRDSRLQIHYAGQVSCMNDCLHRYRHDFRYTALYDMDEIIVPNHQATWNEMLALFPKDYIGAYLFRNSFFGRVDTRVTSMDGDYCPLVKSDMQFTNNLARSVKFFPPYRRTKSIVDPQVVTKVGIHFARDYVLGFTDYVVPVEIAYLHHYNSKNFKPRESVSDNTLLKHKNELLRAVYDKLRCWKSKYDK
ncbi:PREDICTED: uncharacterized protein LOC106807713 [Priapulus caudatus]|uniref:Glycosyltransferase family 92 protein n=1 Tax=Priapulus caudatus TaxID=37621 RepID=A0ABM1E0B2_PRICU|nr:PREDICTED: uncharacterized protein LOC106807713 [Priapulus caudatus]